MKNDITIFTDFLVGTKQKRIHFKFKHFKAGCFVRKFQVQTRIENCKEVFYTHFNPKGHNKFILKRNVPRGTFTKQF